MAGYRTNITPITPPVPPPPSIVGSFISAALWGEQAWFAQPQLQAPFTDTVTITTTSLPVGLVGVAYTAIVNAIGGTLPYTWSAGGLPAWASFNTATGTITGTPVAGPAVPVTFVATDSLGRISVAVILSLTVSGVGLGAYLYAGGSDPKAYVAPSPVQASPVVGVVSSLPPAPRFTFFSLTSSTYASAAQITRLGRADFVQLSVFDGVGFACTANGNSFGNMVSAIQAQGNGAGNTLVSAQYLPDTMGTDPISSPGFPTLGAHIEAMNWDLYNLGTSGTKTPNYFNASWTLANSTVTANIPIDANRFYLEDYWASSIYNYFVAGTFGGSNQAHDHAGTLNAVGHDNFVWRVPTTADWLRTGVGTQSAGGTADAPYRTGLARGFAWLQNNHPGIIRLGNVATWMINGLTPTLGPLGGGLVQGGIIEGWIGVNYSEETFNSLAAAKTQYQYDMANTSGQYVMPALYWDSNGRDYLTNNVAPWNSQPNFQASRYALCSAMQDDGWPVIANVNSDYNSSHITWTDEMSVNPATFVATGEAGSTSGKGYMGNRHSVPWNLLGQGVYGTTYLDQLGRIWVAFVNPKNNGTQVITIATYFPGFRLQLISGTQAPTVNSGAIVTTITLTDRDGRIGCLVP